MDAELEPAETDEAPEDGGAISKYAISLEDLERSSHVAVDDQVIEVPSTEPGRAPGDDEFTRNLRGVINPGV